MARPTTNRKSVRVRVPDTIGDSLTQLAVQAPVHEVVRDEAAAAIKSLADFAGVAVPVFGQAMIKREQEGAAQAERDIQAQIFDQEAFEKNAGYQIVRETNRGKVHTTEELPGIMAEVIAGGLDERTLQEVLKDFDDRVMGVFTPNPTDEAEEVYLREVGRNVEVAREQLIEDKLDLDAINAKDAAAADFIRATAEDAADANNFDWQTVWDESHEIADGRDANKLMFDSADSRSRSGYPEVWATLPDSFTDAEGNEIASIKNIPLFMPQILSSLIAGKSVVQKAETARIAKLAEEQTRRRIVTYTDHYEDAEVGRLNIVQVLMDAQPDSITGLSLLTESEAQSLITANMRANQSDMMLPSYIELAIAGELWRVPPKWRDETLAGAIATFPEDQQMGAGVDMASRGGHLGQMQEDFMVMAQPGTPAFAPAYDMYQAFNGQNPSFLDGEITSKRLATFRNIDTLILSGHTPEGAMEMIHNIDMSLANEVDQRDLNEAIQDSANSLVDPGIMTWRNLDATPLLLQIVKRQIRINLGQNMPLELAANSALMHLELNLVEIDDRYHSKQGGWHPTAPQESADYWKENMIPQGEDPDKWQFTPALNEPAYAILAPREDGLPGGLGRAKVLIADIRALYENEQHRLSIKAQSEQMEANRAALELRAQDQMFPQGLYPTQQGSVYANEAWGELTQREVDDMLMQILQIDELRLAEGHAARLAQQETFGTRR